MVGKEAAGCTPGEAPERVDPPTSVSGCVVEVMMVVMAWRGSSRAVSRSFIEGWVMRVPGDGGREKLRERKRQCKDEGRRGEGEKRIDQSIPDSANCSSAQSNPSPPLPSCGEPLVCWE